MSLEPFDADLCNIRNRASGMLASLTSMSTDCRLTAPPTHGVDNYGIPSDIVDEVQHKVDDTVPPPPTKRPPSLPPLRKWGTLMRTSIIFTVHILIFRAVNYSSEYMNCPIIPMLACGTHPA
jgi:hypothetical protein